jgi:tetratricopeptide (TPR) repeat protein
VAKRPRSKPGPAGKAPKKARKPEPSQTRPSTSDSGSTQAQKAPVPFPQLPGPSPAALERFRQGMDALQRHNYQDASGSFRSLLENHPDERALLDRVRVYLVLCERELRVRAPEPRSIEDRLTAATAALNDGNNARAENLARSVLAEDPRHDLALYLLAAVEARRGAAEQALSYLGQAVAISPEIRAQARHDADFESLRDLDLFHELTELPGIPPSARRARRGRIER